MMPALSFEVSELLQFVSLKRPLHASDNFLVTQWKDPVLFRPFWSCFTARENKNESHRTLQSFPTPHVNGLS